MSTKEQEDGEMLLWPAHALCREWRLALGLDEVLEEVNQVKD